MLLKEILIDCVRPTAVAREIITYKILRQLNMLTPGMKEDMNRRLRNALEAVKDEQSFIQFLLALTTDWEAEQEIESVQPSSPYSSGALGWESGTIGTFLDASCRWGSASAKGLRFYQVPENPWRRAADIIFAGKGYE